MINLIKQLILHNIISSCGKLSCQSKKKLRNMKELLEEVIVVTKFIKIDPMDSLRERIHCISNNITKIPGCTFCEKPVTFQLTGKTAGDYNKYCSKKCANLDTTTKANIQKATNISRYGVDNYFKTSEFNEKRKLTNLERYGTEHPQQNKDIREKTKATNLIKYGVANPQQNKDIREKTKATNLIKYGTEHPQQNTDIREKTKATNLIKYGVEYYNQKNITSDALEKLNNKRWLQEQHFELRKPLEHIAIELEVNGTTVGRYLHKHGLCTQYYYNTGGYSKEFFNNFPVEQTVLGQFYVIRLHKDNENFLKLGITKRRIEERCIAIPYKVEILLFTEGTMLDMFELEQYLLQQFKQYQYFPNIAFGGMTECLSFNAYPQLEKLSDNTQGI